MLVLPEPHDWRDGPTPVIGELTPTRRMADLNPLLSVEDQLFGGLFAIPLVNQFINQ